MPYTIEQATNETKREMVDYLKQNEERSLFLLGNYETHGFTMTDAPYSGNFKLIRQGAKVVGVFCLSKQGNLVIQADVENVAFEPILSCCKQEKVPLRGVLGDWKVTSPLWNYLKAQNIITQENYSSKEVLYALELDKQPGTPQGSVRLLSADDYASWMPLRRAYIKELGFQADLTEDEMRKHFIWKTTQKITWGLFSENRLVSIADLNAKALDLGQLGGVYTLTSHRSQGFAKSLIQQLLFDTKELHAIRKLIIFTNENNRAARSVYESLNVNQIGYYGVLFGR